MDTVSFFWNGEIYDQLSVPEGRTRLRGIAENIVYQIKEYQKYGFSVLGILGIGGSPTCGVEITYYKQLTAGKGAFMEELSKALEANDLHVPIRGISDLCLDQRLAIMDELIARD